MPLERLQCPSCGASVTPKGRDSFFCSYCGVRLIVKTGASGNPMAVLDSIKDDTGLLAKRSALDHLEAQLQQLTQHKQTLVPQLRLAEDQSRKMSSKGCSSAVAAVAGVMCVLLGFISMASQDTETIVMGIVLLVLGVLGLGYFVIVQTTQQDTGQERIDAVYEQIGSLNHKMRETKERAATIRAEIDEIVGRM